MQYSVLHRRASRSAFTLLELSIVLVVVGLIIGGILEGRELIRASELRTILTQKEEWGAAITTFKTKYFFFPGDLPNAQSVWGVQAGCPFTDSTDTKTCNGDGDSRVEAASANSDEKFRAWQHLHNAGLITGKTRYSGTIYNGTIDVPLGKIDGTMWEMQDHTTKSGSSEFFNGVYGHSFIFHGGRIVPASYSGVLTPLEAWDIDTKLDDGKPAVGNVVVVIGDSTGLAFTDCTDTASAATLTASYLQTSSSSKVCSLAFRNQF